MTDGARTRDLRSHNSSEPGPVCPDVSVESVHLQGFREIEASTCPLRTGAYQPGCSTFVSRIDSLLHVSFRLDHAAVIIRNLLL